MGGDPVPQALVITGIVVAFSATALSVAYSDLANNNGGWQWSAGTGTDAQPWFRIFNPIAQAAKFDPEGEYIRRYVPEVETRDYPAPIIASVASPSIKAESARSRSSSPLIRSDIASKS